MKISNLRFEIVVFIEPCALRPVPRVIFIFSLEPCALRLLLHIFKEKLPVWDDKKHIIIEDPPLNIALYQPEIPANTGNIARLCGAAGLRLHLIHPLGFKTDDRHLKRAGLDYWHEIDVRHHESFDSFLCSEEGLASQIIAFSSHASQDYTKATVKRGDYLLFGKESVGLPPDIKGRFSFYKIPILGNVRSLNLSTAVGIVTYHYLNRMGCF
ncbi:MAG: tRNA (cytidine(34)-2'-O)-methyltransferase [Deltaproteobacteria bacterium]|nr:tRNA (cytidine(34)-2'-O)-methyltransferase [Deltaproteobacteria bacterium]